MADVGLGQLVTATARNRKKAVGDAIRDSMPLFKAMEELGGVERVSGGRSIVRNALSGANTSGGWVGPNGQASLNDQNVLDAAEFNWYHILHSVVFTLSEQYMNEGGDKIQYVPLLKSKFTACESSQKNKFHSGFHSNGTADGGLQMAGLPALVSTTPTTGTVGGINRASADAVWFRNQAFNTATDWTSGAVDAGNVTQFLDQGIDGTMLDSMLTVNVGSLGLTHWQALSAAVRGWTSITSSSTEAKVGHNSINYRGVRCLLGGGLNYSGTGIQTATRTYLLNVEEDGVNVTFHKKAEFDFLPNVGSADQAAISRLMFTMVTMTIGAKAKSCWVGFD